MSDDRCSLTVKRAPLDSKDGEAATDPGFGNVDLVLRVTEGDIRMVEAYYHELALEASQDRSPPTLEEQIALKKLAASFERLKAMTREELLAERARRLRQRRRLE
jgi:hypothetical protein